MWDESVRKRLWDRAERKKAKNVLSRKMGNQRRWSEKGP